MQDDPPDRALADSRPPGDLIKSHLLTAQVQGRIEHDTAFAPVLHVHVQAFARRARKLGTTPEVELASVMNVERDAATDSETGINPYVLILEQARRITTISRQIAELSQRIRIVVANPLRLQQQRAFAFSGSFEQRNYS